MIAQMEEALEFGKSLIDTELDAGVLNFILKPMIKTFYNYWSSHDAREGTLEQIKITLDSAKTLLNNGKSEEKFEKIVEKNFQSYLGGDQIYRQCRKQHKNFKGLIEISKEKFTTQLRDAVMFLDVREDDVEDYDGIVRSVYKTKEKAHESLSRQLGFNEAGIKIVEKDTSILKVPTGKNIIIKVLRKGFEKTKSELFVGLDNIFS